MENKKLNKFAMVDNWSYSNPSFEYEFYKSDWETPWAGHKVFGYDLIANLKPKTVVELGTAAGTSIFSFAQAAKDNSVECKLFAIDSWDGDVHAGKYDGSVYESVVKIRNSVYPDVHIELLKMYFEEAVSRFTDSSINLLHVDGLHTYEAVKHDFVTWFPKLSKDAVVIFHDISEHKGDFGVHRYWDELKEKYSTMEFQHSHGLGVLFLSKETYDSWKGLEEDWNIHYLRLAYQMTKHSLYESKVRIRELDEIKNSKFYRLKEVVKKILRR